MPCRINFINPFGTTVYDGLISETLTHYAMSDTELTVTHLDGCPPDMDYFYPKHFVEMALLGAIKQSEDDGYDAVISGCCYDPAVLVAREIVDIPVIGPMEASLAMLPYHGRTAAIVTDHTKACALMKDIVKVYGATAQIIDYDVIDWYVRDMINDTGAVARDVISVCGEVARNSGTEAIILNCTIIAAAYQRYLMNGGEPAGIPIVNPNLMALKMAETTAHLNRQGALQLSRSAFYARPPAGHFEAVSQDTRDAWNAVRPALRKRFE